MKPLKIDDKKTGKILLEFGILFMILNLLCAVEIWQAILHNWRIAGDRKRFTDAFIFASGNYQITYLNQQSVYLSFLSVIFSFLGNKEELVLIANLLLQILGIIFSYFATRKMSGSLFSLLITAVMAGISGWFYPVFSESSMHMIFFVSALSYWVGMEIVGAKATKGNFFLYSIIGLCAGMIFYVDFAGVLPICLIAIYVLLSERYKGKREAILWFLLAVAVGFLKVFSLWNSLDGIGWNRWLADRRSFFQIPEIWQQYLAITAVYSLGAVAYIVYSWRMEKAKAVDMTELVGTDETLKKIDTKPAAETEMKATTDAETLVKPEIKPETDAEALTKPEIKSKTDATILVKPEIKPETGVETLTKPEIKSETNAEEEKPKVKLLDNPLPLPKKHVKKEMNYAFEPSEDQMHYDLNNYRVDDDYDLKTNV